MVKRKKLPPGEVAGIVTDESVMLYDIGHLMGKSDIGRIATKYRCGAQTVRDILNGKSLSGCLSSSRLETGQGESGVRHEYIDAAATPSTATTRDGFGLDE
ncbi:hypothetical protein F444_09573 [Phytophthora nicotianae P1976]|uniref:Uncharacterized protein n=1 Tax=Phytophthora nicotianae P1976 TaxID=1317066 RepID=A0A081A7B4_PHYNI|nr:hypothetical protein F444_09573 [Phytophthora nicotianae P1976]